ncbi:hypothetical protein SADUNF_Sadunf03G0134100 [Salix dunnii]|uniref:Uncharacterized protein n=1 Tax=Salix dunnii TaxID=1413687 RepID=A0A835N4P7_9ROSI|nr:hypothetical protein SADUNF_Sadunf03G0134100 [Salix dunnii]
MFAPSVNSVIGNANHSSSPSISFWSKGVYTPICPLTLFNYTGNPPNNTMVRKGNTASSAPFQYHIRVHYAGHWDEWCREPPSSLAWLQFHPVKPF